jgi:DNA-binding response OmpR family regulator
VCCHGAKPEDDKMIVQVKPLNDVSTVMTHEVLVSDAEQSGYVLVVEDDASICEVISTILSDAGYASDCAQSAEQALRLVQDRPPGLILLDLSVAGSQLNELVTAYRGLADGTAPIVIMSGHPRARALAAEIGADAFIEKPFDLLVLLDTVEAAFER